MLGRIELNVAVVWAWKWPENCEGKSKKWKMYTCEYTCKSVHMVYWHCRQYADGRSTVVEKVQTFSLQFAKFAMEVAQYNQICNEKHAVTKYVQKPAVSSHAVLHTKNLI